MKRNLKLLMLLMAVLFGFGLSAIHNFTCDIAVTGDADVAADAVNKAIITNALSLFRGPESVFIKPVIGDGWYRIDSLSFRWSSESGKIHLECSVITGAGCSQARFEKMISKLLKKSVAQASQESGIEMQILEIRNVKTGEQIYIKNP